MIVQAMPYPKSVGGHAYGFVAAGSVVSDVGGGTIVVPYPAGLLANDLIILLVGGALAGGTESLTDPPGWTRCFTPVDIGSTVFMLWKRATGTETGSLSVTHNGSVTNDRWNAVMVAYGGCVTSGNPIVDPQTATGSGATVNYPSVNLSAANQIKLNMAHRKAGTVTFGLAAGFSQDAFDPTGVPGFTLQEKQFASSGATGTQAGSVSPSGGWGAASFGLLAAD